MESFQQGSYATICRLCMQRDGFMLGIFNHFRGKERSIYRKIMDCTELQISLGDGLPNCICHRCLYKIELCIEFRQQCSTSDTTLRQLGGFQVKPPETTTLPPEPSSTQPEIHVDNDVVMVVDPTIVDYDSEYDTDNEPQSDVDNTDYGDLYEFRNVFICKYCDQAFSGKAECAAHEATAHDHTTPYNCKECEMGFGDRGQFSAHLKSVHQNDKPYNCPECERTFARRSDLRKHTVVHTGIKPFTCSICLKSFSRNTNLSKHMRIHSGQKPFVCPKCPKTFISRGDLTRHAIIHSGQKPFSCNYCPLSFGRRDKLLRHEKRHFPQTNEDKSQELEAMRQNLAMTDYGYNSVRSDSAGAGGTEDRTTAEDHQDGWTTSENMVISLDPFNHNLESTPQEDQAVNDAEHMNGDQDASSNVETSDFENKTNETYVNPSATSQHVPENPDSDSQAEKRKLLLTTGIKRYPCLRCKKRFFTADSLHSHMAVHSVDPSLSCHICGKAFTKKRELDRHVVTHTGMKPFKCRICNKQFGRKDKLIRHSRLHEIIKEEHSCHLCGASFSLNEELVSHLRAQHLVENEHRETLLSGT